MAMMRLRLMDGNSSGVTDNSWWEKGTQGVHVVARRGFLTDVLTPTRIRYAFQCKDERVRRLGGTAWIEIGGKSFALYTRTPIPDSTSYGDTSFCNYELW
jgi:hypothetical protein